MTERRRTKPTYSPEFKTAAIAKCSEIGINPTSRELGVSPGSLKNWIQQSKGESLDSGKPSYQDLERENQRLRREIGYVTEINKVLKKSTAIFSSNEIGGLK